MQKDLIKSFEYLIDHPFTIIQMSDREKFHTGLLQYALKIYPKLYKLIFDIHGEFNSKLEFESIDLYIYESKDKKKPYVLVESKFKTGLHLSRTKNGEVKQIQKYADKFKDASKGYLISLFPESENLKINDHVFIKEYKNITFTGEILTQLERIQEGDSKKEDPLLDLWVSYLKELKIIIDFIKQQQLKLLNLNVYNNNKDFEDYSDELKLSGLFENYRLNLIKEEINEAIIQEKKVICFEKKNYEYFSRIDNTHGNALLHYEKKFENPPHEDFISYGIQWQTDKIKFYIRSKNKKVNKIRDEYLSKFGKLLQDKVFPDGIDLKLNPNGKFKSISIHEHSMFDDLKGIPDKIIELLNCLENIKTSINEKSCSQ
ncbi:hypothetical protein N9K44_03155 [Flavobacteriaceae bacterium]|nr:hypothetical protein [Flavobacteriaceae bacterium]